MLVSSLVDIHHFQVLLRSFCLMGLTRLPLPFRWQADSYHGDSWVVHRCSHSILLGPPCLQSPSPGLERINFQAWFASTRLLHGKAEPSSTLQVLVGLQISPHDNSNHSGEFSKDSTRRPGLCTLQRINSGCSFSSFFIFLLSFSTFTFVKIIKISTDEKQNI